MKMCLIIEIECRSARDCNNKIVRLHFVDVMKSEVNVLSDKTIKRAICAFILSCVRIFDMENRKSSES